MLSLQISPQVHVRYGEAMLSKVLKTRLNSDLKDEVAKITIILEVYFICFHGCKYRTDYESDLLIIHTSIKA